MMPPLPPAANLIRRESAFQQGSLAWGFDGRPCGTGPNAKPVRFDCLGAFLWAYRAMAHDDRHQIGKRLFHTCEARHKHKRLGRLDWEESLALLTDCGV